MDHRSSRIERLLAASTLGPLAPAAPRPGGTSSVLVPLHDAAGPRAAAKLAAPGLPGRRVDAEAHVLGVIGPRAGLPVPPLLARAGDDLLIGWVDGEPPTPTGTLAALARIHAAPLDDADARWLAPWGRGSPNEAADFGRRARRLARRTAGFVAHLEPPRRPAWTRRLETVAERFEAASRRLRAHPHRTLLHGDMHAGHAIARPSGTVLVDWQHASIGPPGVDVIRVLLEWPSDAADPNGASAAALAARHVPGAGAQQLDDLVTITIAGLVSGFGARAAPSIEPWERRILDAATDPGGWGALRLDGM